MENYCTYPHSFSKIPFPVPDFKKDKKRSRLIYCPEKAVAHPVVAVLHPLVAVPYLLVAVPYLLVTVSYLLSTVPYLLVATNKVDINCKYALGRTALSIACQAGEVTIAVMLLATMKADINSKDIRGRTPLSLASEAGSYFILRHPLVRPVDIDSKDVDGHTALWHAARRGKSDIMKLLREAGAEESDTKITDTQMASEGNHWNDAD
jgi:ankyrin repeat protein